MPELESLYRANTIAREISIAQNRNHRDQYVIESPAKRDEAIRPLINNMSSILVSGSLAHDYLLTFPGAFQDELIDHNAGQFKRFFYITDKSVFFGGCAGNIAYNGKNF